MIDWVFFDVRGTLADGPGDLDVLHVGDRLSADVEGAAAAGIRPCWLRRPEGKDSGLTPPPGVPWVTDLRGVLPLAAG